MSKIIYLAVLVGFVASYEEVPCTNSYGKCVDESVCPCIGQKPGLCPTQPNIQCCIAYAETDCNNLHGKCQWQSGECGGNYFIGQCPTQHAHIR